MKASKLSLEGSFVLFLISATVAHGESSGGGIAGLCSSGSFCHSIVDSFGHGLFGTSWIGFVLVFGIWTVGVIAILRYILRNLEIEVRDHEVEEKEKGFTLLAR